MVDHWYKHNHENACFFIPHSIRLPKNIASQRHTKTQLKLVDVCNNNCIWMGFVCSQFLKSQFDWQPFQCNKMRYYFRFPQKSTTENRFADDSSTIVYGSHSRLFAEEGSHWAIILYVLFYGFLLPFWKIIIYLSCVFKSSPFGRKKKKICNLWIVLCVCEWNGMERKKKLGSGE